LKHALVRKPEPVEWDENSRQAATAVPGTDADEVGDDRPLAH